MKKENAEVLQWFVNFANLDLERIKPGDKAKLLVEAAENLWPTKELRLYQHDLEQYASQIDTAPPLSEAFKKRMAWIEIPSRDSPGVLGRHSPFTKNNSRGF